MNCPQEHVLAHEMAAAAILSGVLVPELSQCCRDHVVLLVISYPDLSACVNIVIVVHSDGRLTIGCGYHFTQGKILVAPPLAHHSIGTIQRDGVSFICR